MTDMNPAYGEVTANNTTLMTKANPAYGEVRNTITTATTTTDVRVYDTVQLS